jgi:hypothetical protein
MKQEKKLIKVTEPQIPQKWNYPDSVNKVKAKIYKWKNLTSEIAQELYITREKLKAPGKRTDLEPVNKSLKVKTWGDYCREVTGIEDKRGATVIVNRWINRFFQSKEYKEELELPHIRKSDLISKPTIPPEYIETYLKLAKKDSFWLNFLTIDDCQYYGFDLKNVNVNLYLEKVKEKRKELLERSVQRWRRSVTKVRNELKKLAAYLDEYKEYFGPEYCENLIETYFPEFISKKLKEDSEIKKEIKSIRKKLRGV